MSDPVFYGGHVVSRCTKQRYFSRREVEEALADAQAKRPLEPWRKEQRAYACWSCSQRAGRGVFHLTSEPAMPSGRVREG